LDKPVHLTIDECKLIVQVADDALHQLGNPPIFPDGARLRSVVEMKGINSNPFAIVPLRRQISREDLDFLAPYIDGWINGNAPPQNLPAEYEDWRPDALRTFKERMIREKLWSVTDPTEGNAGDPSDR
jgi:hypothetical protein